MHFQNITNREKEILLLVANEYTTPQIASELFLSPHTVESHKKRLKSKLEVKNTAGMIQRGFELGLLCIHQNMKVASGILIPLFMLLVSQIPAQSPFSLTFETTVPNQKVFIPTKPGEACHFFINSDNYTGVFELYSTVDQDEIKSHIIIDL